MTIREYKHAYSKTGMPDTVLYAGEYLESLGLEFLKNFGTGNAVDKAAKALTDSLEGESWAWGLYEWE